MQRCKVYAHAFANLAMLKICCLCDLHFQLYGIAVHYLMNTMSFIITSLAFNRVSELLKVRAIDKVQNIIHALPYCCLTRPCSGFEPNRNRSVSILVFHKRLFEIATVLINLECIVFLRLRYHFISQSLGEFAGAFT